MSLNIMEELYNHLKDFVWGERTSTKININDQHEIHVQYFYKKCYTLSFVDTRLPREFIVYELEPRSKLITYYATTEGSSPTNTILSPTQTKVVNEVLRSKSNVVVYKRERPERYEATEFGYWGTPTQFTKIETSIEYLIDFEQTFESLLSVLKDFLIEVGDKVESNNKYVRQ